MTDYNRPSDIPAWAESGDKVAPTNAEVQAGWPLTSVPPSRQRFNWLLNWLANAVRYIMQLGVPEWSSTETYRQYSRVTYNGLTYRAKAASTNKQPDSNPTEWERWGYASTEILPRVDSVLSKSVAGNVDVTLTATEADNGVLLLTGALTGNINVILPNTGRRWVVSNATTGSYTLSLKTASGSAVEVKQGVSVVAYCDGANTVALAGSGNLAFMSSPEFPYSGSTTISTTYTPGSIVVTRDGSVLQAANYTATNGTSITVPGFTSGTLKVFKFESFNVANTYTKAEVDAKAAGSTATKAGVSSSLFVTPADLFSFAKTTGTGEWSFMIPGTNIIVKVGTATMGAGAYSDITFAAAFPTRCRGAWVQRIATSDGQEGSMLLVRNLAASGFRVTHSSGASPAGVYWLAIGE